MSDVTANAALNESAAPADTTLAPTSLSRRQTLHLLGAASLTLAATPLSLAQTAPATPASPEATPAPAPTLNGTGFYRQRIGDFTVTTFSDGLAPLPALLPTWGANPDRQDVFRAALQAAYVPEKDTVNHFGPVLVETAKNRVLIDTGRGGQTGQLLKHLKAAGIDPDSIDTVFITHGHGDHIGGITTDRKPTFAKAQLIMGRAEFEFWAGGTAPNASVQANLIALKSAFKLIEAGAEIVPGLTSIATPGHTLDHLSVLVKGPSSDQSLLVLGDAGGHFLLSVKFPGSYVGFDTDGALAARTRASIFAQAAAEHWWISAYHFPFPALGHVARDGEGYAFVETLWT